MLEPTGMSSRWKLHSEEYPAVSAATAKAARFCGVAHAPDTGAPNPISILLSLTALDGARRRPRGGGDNERPRSVNRRLLVTADPRPWIATLLESHGKIDNLVRPLSPEPAREPTLCTHCDI